MKLLNYAEQNSVCAQNQNPFVQNKPYNPNQVLADVITHLMDGNYPTPGHPDEAERTKALFIKTLQVLHENDLPINENSIVKMRDVILAKVDQATSALEQAIDEVPTSEKPATASEEKECDHIKLEFGKRGILLKKEWIKWGVIAIIILLIIKIFR